MSTCALTIIFFLYINCCNLCQLSYYLAQQNCQVCQLVNIPKRVLSIDNEQQYFTINGVMAVTSPTFSTSFFEGALYALFILDLSTFFRADFIN